MTILVNWAHCWLQTSDVKGKQRKANFPESFFENFVHVQNIRSFGGVVASACPENVGAVQSELMLSEVWLLTVIMLFVFSSLKRSLRVMTRHFYESFACRRRSIHTSWDNGADNKCCSTKVQHSLHTNYTPRVRIRISSLLVGWLIRWITITFNTCDLLVRSWRYKLYLLHFTTDWMVKNTIFCGPNFWPIRWLNTVNCTSRCISATY